jgi:hypothetical protein
VREIAGSVSKATDSFVATQQTARHKVSVHSPCRLEQHKDKTPVDRPYLVMVVLRRLSCIGVSLPSAVGAVYREIQLSVTPPEICGPGEVMVLIIIHHCCGRWQH